MAAGDCALFRGPAPANFLEQILARIIGGPKIARFDLFRSSPLDNTAPVPLGGVVRGIHTAYCSQQLAADYSDGY